MADFAKKSEVTIETMVSSHSFIERAATAGAHHTQKIITIYLLVLLELLFAGCTEGSKAPQEVALLTQPNSFSVLRFSPILTTPAVSHITD